MPIFVVSHCKWVGEWVNCTKFAITNGRDTNNGFTMFTYYSWHVSSMCSSPLCDPLYTFITAVILIFTYVYTEACTHRGMCSNERCCCMCSSPLCGPLYTLITAVILIFTYTVYRGLYASWHVLLAVRGVIVCALRHVVLSSRPHCMLSSLLSY